MVECVTSAGCSSSEFESRGARGEGPVDGGADTVAADEVDASLAATAMGELGVMGGRDCRGVTGFGWAVPGTALLTKVVVG